MLGGMRQQARCLLNELAVKRFACANGSIVALGLQLLALRHPARQKRRQAADERAENGRNRAYNCSVHAVFPYSALRSERPKPTIERPCTNRSTKSTRCMSTAG